MENEIPTPPTPAPRKRGSGGGRNQHVPTDQTRNQVEILAVTGCPQEVIADVLDITPKTLRKHYRKILETSLYLCNSKVGGMLYNKALKGDTAAMIFWMKTRGKWAEVHRDPAPSALPDHGQLTGNNGEATLNIRMNDQEIIQFYDKFNSMFRPDKS